PSEYARLERHVAGELESGVAGLDGAEAAVIEQVAEWLDVDADRLMMLQQARALESETGLPAPLFYGLGHGGAGLTVEELVDVPIHELRAAVEEALADNIVEPDRLASLDAHLEQLAHHVVARAMRPDRSRSDYGLTEMLEAADIAPDT